MPRKAASINQADIARAIRVAKQQGWNVVRITTPAGGTIEISESPDNRTETEEFEPLGAL